MQPQENCHLQKRYSQGIYQYMVYMLQFHLYHIILHFGKPLLSGQPLLSSQLADIPEDDRLIEVWLYLSIHAEPAFPICNIHVKVSVDLSKCDLSTDDRNYNKDMKPLWCDFLFLQ